MPGVRNRTARRSRSERFGPSATHFFHVCSLLPINVPDTSRRRDNGRMQIRIGRDRRATPSYPMLQIQTVLERGRPESRRPERVEDPNPLGALAGAGQNAIPCLSGDQPLLAPLVLVLAAE